MGNVYREAYEQKRMYVIAKGIVVAICLLLLVWNGVQKIRIKSNTREEKVEYKAYSADMETDELCRMEVKCLITVGEEKVHNGGASWADAYYCYAILTDGSGGMVKLKADTGGSFPQKYKSWLSNDGTVQVTKSLTLLGKTEEMPNLKADYMDTLVNGESANNIADLVNASLKDTVMLDTIGDYKETRQVIPEYATLGGFVVIVVIGLVFLTFSALKDLVEAAALKVQAQKEPVQTIIIKSAAPIDAQTRAKIIDTYLATDKAKPVQRSGAAPIGTPNRAALEKMAKASQAPAEPEPRIDDETYIQEIKHTTGDGPWQKYDILFATGIYGWEKMVAWADHMASADFAYVDQVTVGMFEKNITEAFLKNGNKLAGLPEVATEEGMLTIAGHSKVLNVPTKIVWYNQTRVLRIHTWEKDKVQIEKYVETMARGTFGTEDAMKLAKPLSKEQP